MKKGTKRDRRREYAIRRNLKKASCVVLLVLLVLAYIGIRKQEMVRSILTREHLPVNTRYGEIPVKVNGEGPLRKIHPEYEQVAEAAARCGASFRTVYEEAVVQFYRNEGIS